MNTSLKSFISKVTEKPRRKTSLMTKTNSKVYINMLKKMQIPFTLTCSNYAAHVHSIGIDKKFVQSLQSKRCFAAFAKLKSNVKEHEVPYIDKSQLIYFQHNFRASATHTEVINLDLKSAYATCLYNAGYITADTYSYLAKISKSDRLASVGMLASKKKIFDFGRDGKPFHYEEKTSELENFFYFAVKKTYDIMSDLKACCGPRYLFTWVDGIYFLPDEQVISDCLYVLEKHNFKWSCDLLTSFEVKRLDTYTKVTFKKEGKSKRFAIPTHSNQFKQLMADTILSFNNKKNKNGKSNV